VSAFLVEPSLIGMLSAYAVDNDLVIYGPLHGKGIYSKKHVAECLAKANLDSITARYPHDRDLNARREEQIYVQDCIKQAEQLYRHFRPAVIAKNTDCLDYQSCETDTWYTSDAFLILTVIRANLVRKLPDYESAAWG